MYFGLNFCILKNINCNLFNGGVFLKLWCDIIIFLLYCCKCVMICWCFLMLIFVCYFILIIFMLLIFVKFDIKLRYKLFINCL